MQSPEEIVPAFLKACPGLESVWEREREDARDGEERLYYIEMGIIARYLTDLLKAGGEAVLARAFGLIEECLETGSARVRELLTIGVLEDVQTIALNHNLDIRRFEQWLGPRSLEAWHALLRAWEGVSSLADMVRKERALGLLPEKSDEAQGTGVTEEGLRMPKPPGSRS